jgi:hypothetical protein
MTNTTETETQTTRPKCGYDGCDKPRFGRGMDSGKDTCSGHYQRERRIVLARKAGESSEGVSSEPVSRRVRSYGEGSNPVGTKVRNVILGQLQAHANHSHGGVVPALVREILELWCEGNQGEASVISEEELPQQGEASDASRTGTDVDVATAEENNQDGYQFS